MIEDAVRYQTLGDDWVTRVLVGGGLITVGGLLGILLLPLVLFVTLNGYMLEVVRRVMRDETTNPPEWGELDLVAVTVNGFRHAVVSLGYVLVLFAAAGLPTALLVAVGVATDSGAVWGLGFLVFVGLTLLGGLALQLVVPVATANFVLEDRIGSGFDLGVLRNIVPNRTMLVAVLFGFGVNVAMSAATSILGFTIVGYLLVPFVVFVGQSAMYYLWARGFADAYREEYGALPAVPDGPVKAGVDVTPAATVAESQSDEGPVGTDPTTEDTDDRRDDGTRWE